MIAFPHKFADIVCSTNKAELGSQFAKATCVTYLFIYLLAMKIQSTGWRLLERRLLENLNTHFSLL